MVLLQLFLHRSIIQVVQKAIESKCKWFKVVEKSQGKREAAGSKRVENEPL